MAANDHPLLCLYRSVDWCFFTIVVLDVVSFRWLRFHETCSTMPLQSKLVFSLSFFFVPELDLYTVVSWPVALSNVFILSVVRELGENRRNGIEQVDERKRRVDNGPANPITQVLKVLYHSASFTARSSSFFVSSLIFTTIKRKRKRKNRNESKSFPLWRRNLRSVTQESYQLSAYRDIKFLNAIYISLSFLPFLRIARGHILTF